VCYCDAGLKPYKRYDKESDQYILECVADACTPGNYDPGTNTCKCPDKKGGPGTWNSYINCPEDVITKFEQECPPVGSACTDPASCYHQCMPDPCNPYGYFNGQECVCDTSLKAVSKEDSTSPVGYICATPCNNSVGTPPCGDPPRGTCYINSKGLPQCKDCTTGWLQDPTGMCDQACNAPGSECTQDDQCCSHNCHYSWKTLSYWCEES
jgi:hypothetical protein